MDDCKRLKVRDVFPMSYEQSADGLFYKIITALNDETLPASDGTAMDEIMPRLYGERILSPTGYLYTGDEIDATKAAFLASHAVLMYGERWKHLWRVYKVEYNPINNYDMVETEETEAETTGSVSGSSSDEIDRTRNESGNIYGFNSSNASPSESGSGSDTESRTGTDSQTSGGTATGSRTLTRSGNIGVTSSMELIRSEIDLWKWSFYKKVMEDVLRLISIPVY